MCGIAVNNMAILQALSIGLFVLTTLCATGHAFKTVGECPKFKDGNTNVTVKLFEDTCYYFYMDQTLTFDQAGLMCTSRKGTLTMPRSQDVSDFLEVEIVSYNTAVGTWVGLVEDVRDRTSAFLWTNGQPVDKEHALDIVKYADALTLVQRHGVWDFSKGNRNEKKHFVCEIKDDTPSKPIPTPPPRTTPPGFTGTVEDCPKFKGDGNDVITKLCEDKCYYFHMKQVMTFEKAGLVCSSRQGSLAMPRSDDISDFLGKEIRSYNTNGGTWLGLVEENNPNVPAFYWTNGRPVDTKYALSILEYANAFTVDRRSGVWDFANSDKGVKNHFVCEIQAEVSTIPVSPPAPTTTVTPSPRKPTMKTPLSPLTAEGCPMFMGDNSDVAVKPCEEYCYYFHWKQMMTFEKAGLVCSSRKGSLAMPRSQDISDFLKQEIELYNADAAGTWIGLLKQNNNKSPTFFWLNGQSVNKTYAQSILQYTNAFTVPRSHGVWNFVSRDSTLKRHFVCQVKKPEVPTTQPPPTTTPKPEIICPAINGDKQHVVAFEKSCFYFEFKEKKNYVDSFKFCQSQGGSLAVVKSSMIDMFLQDALKKTFNKPKVPMWIGLHSKFDSSFPTQWGDGTPLGYSNFRYSFPAWDSYAMTAMEGWESYPDIIRHNFICQFKPTVFFNNN